MKAPPRALAALILIILVAASLAVTLPRGGIAGLLDITAPRMEPAPEVELVSPADGDGTSARVTIVGQAVSSARDVLDVQYRIDGGRWTSAPLAAKGQRSVTFSADVDLPPGDHVLETRAYDGVALSLPARALVRPDAPTVRILEPAHGAGVEAGNVLIAGTVRGADVKRVDLEIDGVATSTTMTADGTWTTTTRLSPGRHAIVARADAPIPSLPHQIVIAAGAPAAPTVKIHAPRPDASYGQTGDAACGGGCLLFTGTSERATRILASLDGVAAGDATSLPGGGWSLRIPMIGVANGTHEATFIPLDGTSQRGIEASVRILARTSLTLDVRGSEAPTRTGTPLAFEAAGADAETATWTLDGDPIAHGAKTTFSLDVPGDHTLAVQTLGAQGRSASRSLTLHAINRPPTLAFAGEPIQRDGALQFLVEGRDPDGRIVEYRWDLGDGQTRVTSEPVLLHSYRARGAYLVRVSAVDDHGAITLASTPILVENAAPLAAFTFAPAAPTVRDVVTFQDASRDPDGILVEREWTFPDGTTSGEKQVAHLFTERGPQPVTLRVLDELGLETRLTHIVNVTNLPPVPAFAHDPPVPLTHQEVLFGDLSTDPDGPLAAWEWDMGDGTREHGASILHVYRAPGEYNVHLNVTDDAGAISTIQRVIRVADSAPEVSDVTLEPAKPIAQEPVLFQVIATDREGGVLVLGWDFGDGVTSNASSPTHRYPRSGWYEGSVRVLDEGGLSATFPFSVRVANAPPATTLHVEGLAVAAFPTRLVANATDPGGRIVFYRFDADADGRFDCESPEPFCVFVYETAATVGARIQVEDDEGGVGQSEIIIDVRPPASDQPPPSVMIEAPTPGTLLRGEVLWRGRAAGAHDIVRVDLQMRTPAWALSGSREAWRTAVGTQVWNALVDTRAFPDGEYELTIRAIDSAGGMGLARVPVRVANGAPPSDVRLHLVDPPTVIDEDVYIRGSAFHPGGVTGVRWRVDADDWTVETENPLAFTIELDRESMRPGDHLLQVEAYHGVTQKGVLTHAFIVPGGRPTLVVDTPPGPIAHGLARAEGRIVGEGRAQWRFDQDVWRDLVPGPSWALAVETLAYRGGNHTLGLRAISPDGRLASDPVTYRVQIVNPPAFPEQPRPEMPTPRETPGAGPFLALAGLAIAAYTFARPSARR